VASARKAKSLGRRFASSTHTHNSAECLSQFVLVHSYLARRLGWNDFFLKLQKLGWSDFFLEIPPYWTSGNLTQFAGHRQRTVQPFTVHNMAAGRQRTNLSFSSATKLALTDPRTTPRDETKGTRRQSLVVVVGYHTCRSEPEPEQRGWRALHARTSRSGAGPPGRARLPACLRRRGVDGIRIIPLRSWVSASPIRRRQPRFHRRAPHQAGSSVRG
jgi:hypothetical protein